MKLGSIKKTDANGRIHLSADIRDLLKITPDVELNVYVERGKVIIAPLNTPDNSCRICGNEAPTGDYYCIPCIQEHTLTKGIIRE